MFDAKASGCRRPVRSDMQTAPGRIVEDGRCDLHRDFPVRHRDVECLSDAATSTRDQRQRDGTFEYRTVVGRGDMPERTEGRPYALRGADLRALLEHHLRVVCGQADELLALRSA